MIRRVNYQHNPNYPSYKYTSRLIVCVMASHKKEEAFPQNSSDDVDDEMCRENFFLASNNKRIFPDITFSVWVCDMERMKNVSCKKYVEKVLTIHACILLTFFLFNKNFLSHWWAVHHTITNKLFGKCIENKIDRTIQFCETPAEDAGDMIKRKCEITFYYELLCALEISDRFDISAPLRWKCFIHAVPLCRDFFQL